MSAPRALQVLQENVKLRPTRYPDYHADLVLLLREALTAVGDGLSATQRRRDLADAVTAKASQIGTAS
jgi:hypothetical protein